MDIHSETFKHLITSLIIIVIAFILSKIVRYVLSKFVIAAAAKLNVDHTKYNFLKNAASFIIFIIAIIVIFYRIPELKDYGVTIFAGAGVFAAIIGFASQSAFSNIITGIFLVIFKPFRVGDFIELDNDMTGQVEDITLRHTVIRNFENRRIVIPNSIISNETIVNSSLNEDETCMHVFFSISYDSNIDLAISLIQDEAEKHPFLIDRRTPEELEQGVPKVIVRLISFGDSSVNLRAQAWAKSPSDGFVLKCDLHKSVKERFDKEGIEIPYPYRTIVYKDKK